MKEPVIVRRYAKALFSVAKDKGKTKEFQADWQAVDETLRANQELYRVILAKSTSSVVKKELLAKVFVGEIDQLVLNFIFLLIDKEREEYILDIKDIYDQLFDEDERIIDVEVITALPLDATQEEELSAVLAKKIGKKVRLDKKIDGALLGGSIIKIGDKIYDGSVAGRLASLQEQLQS
jgi:F-type H+-transporting ATPase subunit delta